MYEFEKLEIWQLSLELIEVVNKSSKNIPYNDSFGLRGQLCRAALSISLNIAEGKGSGPDKEFKRFANGFKVDLRGRCCAESCSKTEIF